MGEAIGAQVEPQALRSSADLVVGVKRVPTAMADAYRGRLLWDCVDAWPQPYGNEWDEAACKQWLAGEVQRIKPIGLIAATKTMAADMQVFGLPVLWLPHHYRPGIERNPIREEVKVIGYEGGAGYIETWRPAIEDICQRIGAKFVLNPPRLADLDIVLALRGSKGYAPRKWKSAVKLANAHGSGTPVIASPERGYFEMQAFLECWADTPEELAESVRVLMPSERRMQVQEQFLKARFSLEEAAGRLKSWLEGL